MTNPPYDVAKLRERQFLWADREERVYLNHASTGVLPLAAVSTLVAWADMRAAPWHITDAMEIDVMHRARELAARLISASSDEIALTPNTTHGINIASRCLPLRAGDVVITPDREFPANVYPWMALEREGVVYERIPCTELGVPDEHAILAALDRPRVRVLSLSWVSFATGYTFDLERIGRACRERDIYFVVDAIQGVGVKPVDAHACQIDILACGGQKWLLSQWGTGFAYVRRELINQLEPRQIGWLAVRGSYDFAKLVDYDLSWYDDARRFEVGTLPYHDLAAFCASVDLLLDVGLDRIAAHVGSLIENAMARLHAAGATVVTPTDAAHRAGILTVRVKDPARASEQLARAGIVCSLREGAIRLSPHLYTTSADIDRALDVLLPEV